MLAALAAASLAAAQPSAEPPPVPYPHPLITEVLYAVPTGPEGDANGDGARHANGDEFVELINPHDRPIQLRGYTIVDRNPGDRGGFRFTFPEVELPPGQVVVLFNGFEQKWKGPVGDSDRAPAAPHEAFAGALVFTMRVASSRVGLSNEHDFVLLAAPDGSPVHCIAWGESEEKPPAGTALVERAPVLIGQSVERASDWSLQPHPHADGRRFSPGKTPLAAPR